MFETTVAIQTTLKTLWWNGLQADRVMCVGCAAAIRLLLLPAPSIRAGRSGQTSRGRQRRGIRTASRAWRSPSTGVFRVCRRGKGRGRGNRESPSRHDAVRDERVSPPRRPDLARGPSGRGRAAARVTAAGPVTETSSWTVNVTGWSDAAHVRVRCATDRMPLVPTQSRNDNVPQNHRSRRRCRARGRVAVCRSGRRTGRQSLPARALDQHRRHARRRLPELRRQRFLPEPGRAGQAGDQLHADFDVQAVRLVSRLDGDRDRRFAQDGGRLLRRGLRPRARAAARDDRQRGRRRDLHPGRCERHHDRIRRRDRHRPDARERRCARGSPDRRRDPLDQSRPPAARSDERLRAGVPVEFRANQYHLRRSTRRRRLHLLVRQAPGVLVRLRPGRDRAQPR